MSIKGLDYSNLEAVILDKAYPYILVCVVRILQS